MPESREPVHVLADPGNWTPGSWQPHRAGSNFRGRSAVCGSLLSGADEEISTWNREATYEQAC